MGGSRWQRAKDVFQAALTRGPEARSAFLEEVCGGDGDLRREVEALLAAHDAAGNFLSGPAALATDSGAVPPAAPAEPRRIGPYRILDTIGQGGMGAVYRAVRDDDAFQKTVALKLVRGGFGSESLERRFRQERQILARLQHPNIATVLDGGTTGEGHSYLVMEHVEGRPITEYCDAHGLGVRERLILFRTVCGAVHYAHQNLVIHRDIKPANVLVDGQGAPKLLDFGIAKLLASGVDPDEAPTATMLPMMTPEYASPEQVKGQAVTTASDVYSLGVLLYELLAGRRPYEVRTDSLEAIVQAVCLTEPKAPSEATGDRTSPAPRLSGLPQASELRGDLDTIVIKALRKEPQRRYLSAHDLADDLRRHLEGLPVLARADTLRYRASKFAGRHKGAVAASALVISSLLAGLVATTRQARIARAERARAESLLNDVRKLAGSFIFEFHDGIKDLPGSTTLRKQVLERAVEYLDRLAQEASSDRALVTEVMSGYLRLGRAQGEAGRANLGDLDGALASLRKAAALGERICCPPSATAAERLLLAETHMDIANTLVSKDDLAGAVATLDKSTRLIEGLAPSDRASAKARRQLAISHWSLANVQVKQDDWQGVKESYGRSLALFEALHRENPNDPRDRANVALNYKNYGAILQKLGDDDGALPYYQKALELDRRWLAEQPENASAKMAISFGLRSIGDVKKLRGDARAAAALYRETLTLQEAVLAADPVDVFARKSVADTRERLLKLQATARERREPPS